jgi:hypothetical protein
MMQKKAFEDQSNRNQYYPAQKISAPKLHIPEGKRLPFKWNAIAISGEDQRLTTELHWDMAAFDPRPACLRITVALDIREEKLVEVFLLQSERKNWDV